MDHLKKLGDDVAAFPGKLYDASLGKWAKVDCDMEMEKLTTGEFWSCAFKTALGSMAWVILASVGGNSSWAWGLAFAISSIAISDNLNANCRFSDFINGKGKLGCYVYSVIFQAIGCSMAGAFNGAFELEGDISAVNKFSFFGDDGSWNFLNCSFWFNSEVWTIVIFMAIYMKSQTPDMPAAFWNIILISVAFIIGGAGFNFFPGHAFVGGFDSILTAGPWALVFTHMWAVAFGNFVLDFCWCW